MTSKLDQSLGDLIKSNPSRGRGGRRGGGSRRSSNGSAPPSSGGSNPLSRSEESNGNSGNGSGPVRRERRSGGTGGGRTPYQRPDNYRPARNFDDNTEWKHDLHQQEQAAQARLNADKIYVSNLDADVNEDDVKEIFGKVGKISKVVINFNQHGKSLGTAEVSFARKGDAEKAVQEYDGAEVDSRPMAVKLVGTMVQPRVVKKRTPPPQQQYQQPQQYQQRPRQQGFQQRPRQSNRGGSSGGRGGRGGRGGGRRGGDKAAVPSADDLDAELDSYHSKPAAPSAAAAGQPPAPSAAAAAGQPTA